LCFFAIALQISNTELNPPMQFSGEVRVVLDTEGRLVSFRAVPPQRVESDAAAAAEPDWKVLFAAAGLDISKWTPAKAQWSPPSYADARNAWQGELPNRPGDPVRLEAAAFQGKAVSFDIIRPWTRATQMEPIQQRAGENFATAFTGVFSIALLGGAVFFALRNLRLGRGDRRNATRLALFIMGSTIISSALSTHHVKTSWAGNTFVVVVSLSLLVSGSAWVLYIAIELFVRRRWPQVLVSWTRLLSGEWRVPLVARDVLAGCALGALAYCGFGFAYFLLLWFGIGEPILPRVFTLSTVLGTNFLISALLDHFSSEIFYGLLMIALLFLLRILLRNQKAVVAAAILIAAFLDGGVDYWRFTLCLIFFYPIMFFSLMRFGIVTVAFFCFFGRLFLDFPVTFDTSAWYSGYGYAALAILAAIVLCAFRTSLGGAARSSPRPNSTTDLRLSDLSQSQHLWSDRYEFDYGYFKNRDTCQEERRGKLEVSEVSERGGFFRIPPRRNGPRIISQDIWAN
jgi:hypothetical protein